MKKMITEKLEKLKEKLEKFFTGEEVGIEAAEAHLVEAVSATVTELLGAYYEKADAELLADKAGRKAAGLRVERKRDVRRVLTQLGEVEYGRTYYQKVSGGYCYPIDELAGVERYGHLSRGVSLALVDEARKGSYARSSQVVTGGRVSRQSVMNKVRQAYPVQAVVERRKVMTLHVDADEDHVKLQDGKNMIVPLLSAYEGVERQGKRGICRNIFHYSRSGEKTDDLWEGFLNELERRYDLSQTTIYLHGDGAAWIMAGVEWLPRCRFVLDRYHKNKAIKQALSGIPRSSACQYEALLRKALDNGDRAQFSAIRDTLLRRWPERSESILQAMNYLWNHFDAISIFTSDPEAARGGATEPHVSHILSARLSSRPMAWSKHTLRHLVPLLATGVCSFHAEATALSSSSKQNSKRTTAKILPFSAGLPLPDLAHPLPAAAGKVSSLSRTLKAISNPPTFS